jgi:hypothetical protein
MAYIQFNAKEALEKAPKTKELLKEYMLKNISEGVPEEFKKQMKEYISKDDTLYTMVGMNPRMMLYDFFDENYIVMTTYFDQEGWHYEIINNGSLYIENPGYENSRGASEMEGWNHCITILEQQLNK